ncbi:unnamed protein product [Brachionus calyciflorus]|uniref:DWNN domain-containing protein n=1 Tax=Brachionus calyciflorus TaxID=104777 RepID=A0A813ZJS4_9BILA|nr:unnamed protein product [Brachionus calyciflorus]
MSHIHFKTVYNLNYDKITFDGSSLTLTQLKKLISEKTKFVKTKKVDFDLEISNADNNIVYANEDEHIFKNSRVIVKRIVKNSAAPLRAQEKVPSQPEPPPVQSLPKPVYDSLAPLNLPSKPLVYIDEKTEQNLDDTLDEKAKLESILMSSMSKTLSDTSLQASRFLGMKQWLKPPVQIYQNQIQPRPIAPGYLCNLCRKPGHLRQFCPEAGTLPKPEERPKFPSGIPKANLRPAQAGDKFAKLGPEGYVVTDMEREAAKVVKKDKFFFDEDEEKAVENRDNTEIPKELRCPFGAHLIKDAVLIPCCGHFICCDECIRTKISNEDLIECPSDKCDQEIGSFTGITPYHEIRKKVNEFQNEMKKFKLSPSNNNQKDAFLDEIMNQVDTKPTTPVQENQITSSELKNQAQVSPRNVNLDVKLTISQPVYPQRSMQHSLSETSIQNLNFNNQFMNGYQGQFRPNVPNYHQNYAPQNNYAQNFNHFQNYNQFNNLQSYNGYQQSYQNYNEEPKYLPKVVEYENLDRTLDIMTEKEFNEYKEKLLSDVNNCKEIEKRDGDKSKKSKKSKAKKSRSRSRSRSRAKKSKKKNKSRSRSRSRDRKRSKSRTRSFSRSRSRSRAKKAKKKSTRKKSNSRSRTKSPLISRKDENSDKIYKNRNSGEDRNSHRNEDSRKNGRKVLRSLSRSPSKYYDDKPKYKYK